MTTAMLLVTAYGSLLSYQSSSEMRAAE